MSEQKIRMRCACAFSDNARILGWMEHVARSHDREEKWKALSGEVRLINEDVYEECLKFDATKIVNNLKQSIETKDRTGILRAIAGLQDAERSICEAEGEG